MPTEYKGWIPTAAGRLSFRFIGETEHPRRTISSNRADRSERYVVCLQERVLLDTVLPFKKSLASFILGLRGCFRFVCIAKSSRTVKNDAMVGKLLIFDAKDNDPQVESEANNARLKLDQFFCKGGSLSDNYEPSFQDATKCLQKLALCQVDFTLCRDGEVTISCDDNYKLIGDVGQSDGANYEGQKDTISAQCFYFLRDIVHHHQHHSPDSDTILDLYRAEDDLNWRAECLKGMYRIILDYKRKRKDEIYCSSLGILAYVKSFKKISAAKIDLESLNIGIDDNNLEASIRASQTATNNSIQSKIKDAETTRNTLISILGLFLTLLGLARLTDKQIAVSDDNLIIKLATWTVTNPPQALAIVLVFIFASLIVSGVIKVGKFQAVRGIYKLTQSFSKEVNILIWFFFGVSCLSLFIYLLFNPIS